MQLIRTTLRLKEHLQKEARKRALEEGKTLQDIFNRALEKYLEGKAKKEAQKIVFKTHDLGSKLDNLKRADYYKGL